MDKDEALKIYREFVASVLGCYDSAETNGDLFGLADVCLDYIEGKNLSKANSIIEFGQDSTLGEE